MLLKPVWMMIILVVSLPYQPVKERYVKKIQWLDLEEAAVRMKADPKPVIIDLYTKWCKWCKEMDQKTYNNDKVISYINDHFYPVKFDAESKSQVQWENKGFNFNPDAKVNDFSLFVTNGQLSFPTTVILLNKNEIPAAIPGFMSTDEIEPILKYFGEGLYKTKSFQEFMKTFKRSW